MRHDTRTILRTLAPPATFVLVAAAVCLGSAGQNPQSSQGLTLVQQANAWGQAIVDASGDRWRTGEGGSNGPTAWYTFHGQRTGRYRPLWVRTILLTCTGSGRTLACYGHGTTGQGRAKLTVNLAYVVSPGSPRNVFTASAALHRG